MAIPHPFPYQGSKRKLASQIIQFMPESTERLIEPFAGSGAVSIAAIYEKRVQSVLLNDVNQPLMALWEQIISCPEELADAYERLWLAQEGQERIYYDQVRTQFNVNHDPALLLFLLVRCVKAAVRYNADGQFNQSPDKRRRGTQPQKMRRQLQQVSQIMKGKTALRAITYHQILDVATPQDVLYLDPPYQGVTGNRDPRYFSGIEFSEFVDFLTRLNRRDIAYIVSYDGRTGTKSYGHPLPKHLQLYRIELDAGRSSQATLLGQTSRTYESLYLSPSLAP